MPLCGVAHFPPNRLNRLLCLRTRLCIRLSRRTCLARRLTVNGSPPLSSSTFPRIRLYFRRSLNLLRSSPFNFRRCFLLSPLNEEVLDSVSGAASLFWGFCTCVATFGFNDCSFSPVGAEPPPLDVPGVLVTGAFDVIAPIVAFIKTGPRSERVVILNHIWLCPGF